MTGVAVSVCAKLTHHGQHVTHLTPAFRPRLPAAWMIGPSAIGSVNGMPISIRSAPASGMPFKMAWEVA